MAPDHVETPTEIGLGRPHEGHGLTGGHSVLWASVQSLFERGAVTLAHDHSHAGMGAASCAKVVGKGEGREIYLPFRKTCLVIELQESCPSLMM